MFAVSSALSLVPPPTIICTERAAPGHPYDAGTGGGIEWQPGMARLWEGGQITARATHATATPFEFWFWLQFAEAFPQVTHWWFGSAWTGQVWLRADPPLPGQSAIMGSLQFGDRAALEQPWQMQPGDPARLNVPSPPWKVIGATCPCSWYWARLSGRSPPACESVLGCQRGPPTLP